MPSPGEPGGSRTPPRTSPLARLQPPPHGEYPRLVAPSLPAPAPCPYSFFRLVPIWVLVAVFIILPKDSIPSLPPLPASHLVALSKLTSQALGAGEPPPPPTQLPSHRSLSLRTALCGGFLLWPSKFGSFLSVPFLLAPGLWASSSHSGKLRGDHRPSARGGRPGSSAPFTACGLCTLACRFGETEETSSFPERRARHPDTSPAHQRALVGGVQGMPGDPSAGELGQCACLLKCDGGTSVQKEGQLVSIRSAEIKTKQTDNREIA